MRDRYLDWEGFGKCRCVSKGSGGRFIEAPHLYHIGEWYCLPVAESGTEYGHTKCMFRSGEAFESCEGCTT